MRTPGSLAALAALAGALLAAPRNAAAQHAVVTADEVRALQKAKKGVVVDARTPEEYRQVRIAGAINVPPERIAAEAARLPKDRAAPIVFYCRGPG